MWLQDIQKKVGNHMQEINHNGNIFMLPDPALRDACCVTTNGVLRNNGKAVMGAGIAKYCRDTFKGVDTVLGDKLKKYGNHAYALGWQEIIGNIGRFMLFSFPTKEDWKADSKPELIQQSCKELMKLADQYAISDVYLPCPGCSNGRLNYWTDVRDILRANLDDRFVVCIPDSIWIIA